MKIRPVKPRVAIKQPNPGVRFETLEPRNLLAVDFGIVDPFSSSLITQVANDIPSNQQLDVLREHLNADPRDSFVLLNQTTDQIGFEHFKYQHFYQGHLVENSTYTVHTRNGLITALSGEYHDVDTAIAAVEISESQALQSAMDFVGAEQYIWQVGPATLAGDQVAVSSDQDVQSTDYGFGCQCTEILGITFSVDTTQTNEGAGCQCASCLGASSNHQYHHHAHQHHHDFLVHTAHDHGLGISLETPTAELVYLKNALAYKFDIYATAPMSRSWVFVDASSGAVIATENRIHDVNVPATGSTLYDANQSFTADFTGSNYRLRAADAVGPPALGGVETYDLNESTNYGNAVDFVSNSQNFGNPEHEVGNQTHWGTEKTWDYFFNQHGRDSWDGAGATLVSYTSYRSNYVNAFWNGSFMTYGDGDGNIRGPLVSLDIVGHEITHGVVQSTAGLIYRNQSGALNESFADIFGEAVENHARNSNDWLMGGDIGLNGNSGQFRSMQNPNQFADPDTYLGDYWYVGNGDQGGVHINSGVMNKWFYIMTVGEAGTNDTGHTYNVAGVGMDDAAAIAYRNLSVYLTANSTYPDARVGAVQAAIDLFGVGSQQHLSTMAAWDAVGVYTLTEQFSLTPVQPMGSQVYTSNAINEVQFDTDEREFDLPLDENQKMTLLVDTMTGNLIPQVTITNPSGVVLASYTATSSTDSVFIENLPAVDAGEYSIFVEGSDGTTGQFEAKLWLNAGIERESLGLDSDNNSPATAQNLDATGIVQGNLDVSTIDRLAVLGELGTGGNVVFQDDLETGTLSSQWEVFSSTTSGQVAVTDDTGTNNGRYAISMDVGSAGVFNLNEAILTLDLTDVEEAMLGFSHVSFGDETHFLPSTFSGHFNGDGVAVSGDGGSEWFTIMTGITPPNGLWQDLEFDLVQLASELGFELSDDFKVKFQQYDNFSRPSDGRGFDNVFVGVQYSEDWYNFTLEPNDSASLALTQLSGEVIGAEIEIYDSEDNLLTSGTAGSGNLLSYIENFVNPAANTETYYVRVIGGGGQYSLLATRNAGIGLELDANQDITGLEGVLGYVSESIVIKSDPDVLANDAIVGSVFEGVTIREAVGGGAVFAVTSTLFEAPTGDKVFSPSQGDPAGFREGIAEFRADFDDPQSMVSIDVGSDDTLDIAFLRAYDADDNLLAEVFGQGAVHSQSETLLIERPTSDIAYILAAGLGSHTAPLDNLVFQDQVLNADLFDIQVAAGDEIGYRSYLPGGGPFEWNNRLGQSGDQTLNMDLYDPAGNLVASNEDLISHRAEVAGTYQLRISAAKFDGEYFVTTQTGLVDLEPLGRKLLDGAAFSGQLDDAWESDDVLWELQPSPTPNPFKQKLDVILVSVAPMVSPTSLSFRLEGSMTGGPAGDVRQSLSLFDHSTKNWELIDVRSIDNLELTVDINADGDITRFINQQNGEVRARLTYISPSFSETPYAWTIGLDEAVWRYGAF